MAVIITKTELTPIKSIKTYDKNPRIGNIEAIAESLEKSGQFKPIVVNSRNNQILAGNHTYLAARKLGWTEIYTSFVDVDDETAKRIVLADNRTSDMGEYDDKVLAELLASLPDISGTGYSAVEIDDLINSIASAASSVDKSIEDMTSLMPTDITLDKRDKRQDFLDNESDESRDAAAQRGAARISLDADKEIEELEDVQTELQAILEMRVDSVYDSINQWGVPSLREDMLAEDIPSPIKTWGGLDATPDDGSTWFLYNYGLGGVRGLPFDRTVLSFFTHDDKFENWWALPAYYTAKIVSSGCRNVIVPDFSFYYTTPRIVHLYNVYRAQWLGRFFQEAGMMVYPRLQFDYMDPNTLEIALLGIPKGVPVLATSQQNIENEKENGPRITAILNEALAELQPKKVLYYSGPPGKRAMEATNYGGEVVYVENYAAVRRGSVFDKKDGMGQLTAAQKKRIAIKAQEKEAARLGIDIEELRAKSKKKYDEDDM